MLYSEKGVMIFLGASLVDLKFIFTRFVHHSVSVHNLLSVEWLESEKVCI